VVLGSLSDNEAAEYALLMGRLVEVDYALDPLWNGSSHEQMTILQEYRNDYRKTTNTETAAENLRIHLKDFSSKIKIINNGANLHSVSDAIPYTKAELLPGCDERIRLIINVARFFAAKDHTTIMQEEQGDCLKHKVELHKEECHRRSGEDDTAD
jgi:hypothetical protein